jgi:peroxiredoxin
MAQTDLLQVDWSKIPPPVDDGAAKHLLGSVVSGKLPATDGRIIELGHLSGRTVIFAYPRSGTPGQIGLVDDWDLVPGARGCTPQACAFRDIHAELVAAGASQVFGLSVQGSAYQRELVERVHLPFPILSDSNLEFATSLNLPTMQVGGVTLLKRLAIIIDHSIMTGPLFGGIRSSRIVAVFYPVFPPDRNAGDVLAWLRANPVGPCDCENCRVARGDKPRES